jgi:hypothetical protein
LGLRGVRLAAQCRWLGFQRFLALLLVLSLSPHGFAHFDQVPFVHWMDEGQPLVHAMPELAQGFERPAIIVRPLPLRLAHALSHFLQVQLGDRVEHRQTLLHAVSEFAQGFESSEITIRHRASASL